LDLCYLRVHGSTEAAFTVIKRVQCIDVNRDLIVLRFDHAIRGTDHYTQVACLAHDIKQRRYQLAALVRCVQNQVYSGGRVSERIYKIEQDCRRGLCCECSKAVIKVYHFIMYDFETYLSYKLSRQMGKDLCQREIGVTFVR
jgi:hypothetical protein